MEDQNSNPLILIAFIVGFVAIFGFVGLSYLKKRKRAFTGQIVDKDIVQRTRNSSMRDRERGHNGGIRIGTGGMSFGNTNTYEDHIVKIKTNEGDVVSMNVSDGMYENLNIGDTVEKPSGSMDLTVIARAANPTNPQQTVAQADPNQQPPTTPPIV